MVSLNIKRFFIFNFIICLILSFLFFSTQLSANEIKQRSQLPTHNYVNLTSKDGSSKFFSPSTQINVPWLVYIYLVGTDLESRDGSATKDLIEIAASSVGNNVRLLVLTGGTRKWHNDLISNNNIQIFEIQNGSFSLVENLENYNTGDPNLLSYFLTLGEKHYTPQHRMIIFWDHGGGYISGVGNDEYFNSDSLEMTEIQQAFSTVYREVQKPFDVIGFDACLMANLSNAYHMSKWGHIMIASQEIEPSIGWYYTQWLTNLNMNPDINLKKLGKNISDSYIHETSKIGFEQTTMSVISLDKIPELVLAYNGLGASILHKIPHDYKRISKILDWASKKSEHYGAGNYAESIDMGNFTEQLYEIAPKEAENVVDLLKQTIIYKKNGKLKEHSSGLSVYYPLDKVNFIYSHVYNYAIPSPFSVIYGLFIRKTDENGSPVLKDNEIVFMLNKENILFLINNIINLNSELKTTTNFKKSSNNYSKLQGYSNYHKLIGDNSKSTRNTPSVEFAFDSGFVDKLITAAKMTDMKINGLSNQKVKFSSRDMAYVKIPSFLLDSVTSVKLVAASYLPADSDGHSKLKIIGTDFRVQDEWNTGTFYSEIDGLWTSINGHILPLSVSKITDEYVIYNCLIKINGELHNMVLTFDFKSQSYSIYGTQRIYANGNVDRIRKDSLKNNDIVTTVFIVKDLITNRETLEEGESFKFSYDLAIEDKEILKDQNIVFAFIFQDYSGYEVQSEFFSVVKDEKGKQKLKKFDENSSNTGQNQDISILEHLPVDITEKSASIIIPEDYLESVNKVALVIYADYSDYFIYLGYDYNVSADWSKGIFREDINGNVHLLGGNLLPLTLVTGDDSSDFWIYATEARVNGMEGYLITNYNLATDALQIIGFSADKGKTISKINMGDKIELSYTVNYDNNGEVKKIYSNPFKFDNNSLSETSIKNLSLRCSFVFLNSFNRATYSENFWIDFDEQGKKHFRKVNKRP